MRHPSGIIQLVRRRLAGRSACCNADGLRLPPIDGDWWGHIRF